MVRNTSADTNPRYWDEYTNLQRVKHDLIRQYLNGWFPKLGSWAGKIIYVDTHAGRGRHSSGELGSPLVAIKTLLDHSYRDTLLSKCEVVFSFIERDEENKARLDEELAALGALPKNITVVPVPADAFSHINSIVESLRQRNMTMAPAFVFVDPYGFKIPGALLRELMGFPRVELFINVIWRELDMARAQGDKPGMGETLDLIFNGKAWQDIDWSDDFEKRAEQVAELFQQVTDARWATYIRMLGKNDATRYLLLHLTNHDAGRDLMKDCVWKVCQGGGFYARRMDDPDQQVLITPEPNLTPLRKWVLDRLKEEPVRWDDLLEEIRRKVWRAPHLNQVVRELRRERKIEGSDYKGKFTPSANPMLAIAE